MNTAAISTNTMAPVVRSDAHRPVAAAANEITLRKGQLHTWTGNHTGLVIEARAGTIWLTQDGDVRDIVLRSGQSFRLTRPGCTIAQSLSPEARVASL